MRGAQQSPALQASQQATAPTQEDAAGYTLLVGFERNVALALLDTDSEDADFPGLTRKSAIGIALSRGDHQQSQASACGAANPLPPSIAAKIMGTYHGASHNPKAVWVDGKAGDVFPNLDVALHHRLRARNRIKGRGKHIRHSSQQTPFTPTPFPGFFFFFLPSTN